VTALLKILPFILVTITLTLMYLFFSRSQITTKAAILGAFFATFFWFLTQQFYIYLQIGVAKYNAIYGSFATIPLFLVWVQLGWSFILLGATLTYAVQNQKTYMYKCLPTTPKRQLQLAYDLLLLVGNDHNNRTASTTESLARRLTPFRIQEIERVLDILIDRELLIISRNKHQEKCYLPVTSIENISPEEIFRAVIGDEAIDTPGARLAEEALQSATDTIKGTPLLPK
jgi:membrane protein